MFCSRCGKTLKPGAEVCSCGQAVGQSRFEGVPYTSAQARIAPGEAFDPTGAALPYTRTTYTGKDEQMQADADNDARTTYRPVYEGASVPEEIRGDVRRAVDGEEDADEPAAPAIEDPLVREMFAEDGESAIDDFDLSQLRSRPITSDGRAGISRDVTEYVEQLEAAERGRRGRRRKVYGAETDEGPVGGTAYAGEDTGDVEDVFADIPEDYGPAARGNMSIALKTIGAVALVAVVAVGIWYFVGRVGDIQQDNSPIAGVSSELYTQGVELINRHADNDYVQSLLTQSQTDGLVGVVNTLNADAQAVEALLPEGTEVSTDDQTFVAALSAIQENIASAVSVDVLALTDTTLTDAEKEARSSENWSIVRNAIAELTSATTTAELTSIIGGETIEVSQPSAEIEATPTPVPYTTLSRGDQSNEVIALQQRLYELGYLNDNIDGNFGSNTQTAVKLFQTAVGLEPTGIADAAMQNALYADDAPRTQYAQPTTQAPTATPTPEPSPETTPDAAGGESAADPSAA